MKNGFFKKIITLFVLVLTCIIFVSCEKTLDEIISSEGIKLDGVKFSNSTEFDFSEVSNVEEKEEILSLIENQSYNKQGLVKVFNSSLSKNGIKIELEGKIKVSIPLDETISKLAQYEIFYIKSDNTVEVISVEIEGDYLVFSADNFSYFVLVEKEQYLLTVNNDFYYDESQNRVKKGTLKVNGEEVENYSKYV